MRLLHPGLVRWMGTTAVAVASTLAASPLVAEESNTAATSITAPPQLMPVVDSQALSKDAAAGEVVRERYPNRQIKIERHVIRTEGGDFVNHGPWIMYNEQGRLLGRGEFKNGKRTGAWIRNFQAGEAPALSTPWGKLFTAPFLCTATFDDNELHGAWAIVDADERPVARWEFDHGVRHGKSVWYLPDGQKWREADYHQGELHGRLVEWSNDGAVVADENYIHGRRKGIKVDSYAPGVKRSEAEFLFAREVTETLDNFWTGRAEVKVLGREDRDLRHGQWTSWYRNGQQWLAGQFDNDAPEGKFCWWHPSGQRSIEGTYNNGKQNGTWTWWHANGRKAIQGEFIAGRQIGAWSWWDDRGNLLQSAVYRETDDALPAPPAVDEPTSSLQASDTSTETLKLPEKLTTVSILSSKPSGEPESNDDSVPAADVTAPTRKAIRISLPATATEAAVEPVAELAPEPALSAVAEPVAEPVADPAPVFKLAVVEKPSLVVRPLIKVAATRAENARDELTFAAPPAPNRPTARRQVVTLLPRPEEAAVDALQPIAEPAHLEEVPTSTGTKRPQRQAVRSAAAPKRK